MYSISCSSMAVFWLLSPSQLRSCDNNVHCHHKSLLYAGVLKCFATFKWYYLLTLVFWMHTHTLEVCAHKADCHTEFSFASYCALTVKNLKKKKKKENHLLLEYWLNNFCSFNKNCFMFSLLGTQYFIFTLDNLISYLNAAVK